MVGLSGADSKNYIRILNRLNYPESTPVIDSQDKISDSYVEHNIIAEINQQQRHLFNNEEEEIIEKYKAGKSTYALAKEYNCHRSTVSRLLKRNGIEVTKTKLNIDDAIRLHEAGHTSTEIAQKYQMNQSAVTRRLRQAGVKMRKLQTITNS